MGSPHDLPWRQKGIPSVPMEQMPHAMFTQIYMGMLLPWVGTPKVDIQVTRRTFPEWIDR